MASQQSQPKQGRFRPLAPASAGVRKASPARNLSTTEQNAFTAAAAQMTASRGTTVVGNMQQSLHVRQPATAMSAGGGSATTYAPARQPSDVFAFRGASYAPASQPGQAPYAPSRRQQSPRPVSLAGLSAAVPSRSTTPQPSPFRLDPRTQSSRTIKPSDIMLKP